MKSRDNTERILKKYWIQKKSEIKTTAEMDSEILTDVLLAYKQSKNEVTDLSKPDIWRTIFKNRIVRFSAAAALIFAIAVVFFPSGGAGVAWGEVAENTEKVQTFFFRLKISTADIGDEKPVNAAEWAIYLSSEYGFRMDTMGDGKIMLQVFVSPEEDMMTWVIPHEKKWIRLPATEEQLKQKKDNDPRELIRKFMSREYTKLGRKTIGSIKAEGIEVKNPPTSGEPLENSVGRLWVDVKTELPVRLEIKGTGDNQSVMWLMDFLWDVELDSGVFEPIVQADFSPLIIEFDRLRDPEYGISVQGLTQEKACEKILQQFWKALLDEDLPLIRKLVPGTADWNDGFIRRNLKLDAEDSMIKLLEIGPPTHETTNSIGPVVVVPSILRSKDGKTREVKMIIQFRQLGGQASCVIYGDYGDPREID